MRVIWLSDLLSEEKGADAVLHELAHFLLQHHPNTAYGADPTRLSAPQEQRFTEQEHNADVFSGVMRRLIDAAVAVHMAGCPVDGPALRTAA